MRRVLLALSALFAPVVALAQSDEPAEAADPAPRYVYQQKYEIDFDAARVEADVATPGGAVVLERRRAQFNPMVHVRESFTPEMLKSIDEIR